MSAPIDVARWATSDTASQYNFMLKKVGNWPTDTGGARYYLSPGVWTLVVTWTGSGILYITVKTNAGDRAIVTENIPAGSMNIPRMKVIEVPITEPSYVNFGRVGHISGETLGMKAINTGEIVIT